MQRLSSNILCFVATLSLWVPDSLEPGDQKVIPETASHIMPSDGLALSGMRGGDLRELVEAEGAAAEIQDIVVGGHVRFEFFGYEVNALLALFFALEESRFAQDAEMFGDVVLGDVQAFGDFVDAEWMLKEQA